MTTRLGEIFLWSWHNVEIMGGDFKWVWQVLYIFSVGQFSSDIIIFPLG